MEERQRFLMLKVGAPGCGKSSGGAEIIKGYSQNVIVFKHRANIDDPALTFLPEKTMDNWRQGVKPGEFVKCKIAGNSSKDYIAFIIWLQGNFRNGLVMIDDTVIFERNMSSNEIINLVAMRRHYGMDIILVYQGLIGLPIDLFPYINYAVFYNTTDEFAYKKGKLPMFEKLQSAAQIAKNNWAMGVQMGVKDIQYKPEIVKFY